MKKINTELYRVENPIILASVSTYEDFSKTAKQLKNKMKQISEKLADFQDVLYANNQHSVLVCIQGMDTSGKDSLIRDVFKGFNSQGIEVHSFKTPTKTELQHDFLWRHYMALPKRGKFGIFNRTHYENVIVTRVHPEYILNENIPKINDIKDVTKDFWEERFEQIRNFEKHLVQNGTILFKFFLHLSKEEQKRRLLQRLNTPSKNWKFSPDDLQERKLWDSYQVCYEQAINKTSSKLAPWYIIPADNKPAARLLVAKILWQTLKQYTNITYPNLNEKDQILLEKYKKQLQNEC